MLPVGVLRLVVPVLLAAPLALLSAAPASASCVSPEAQVAPASAAPGARVTVSSTIWFGVCNDTGQDVDTSDRAVVTFVQGDLRVELGRTSSDARNRFTLPVRVPEEAVAGPAVLQVRGRVAADDVTLTVLAPSTLPFTGGPGPAAALALVVLAGAAVVRRTGQAAG
ncbi:MAG: hypothetical protein JWO60_2981 [Frankiales bacterium]|nr:hypothetical protein [Frankiales bacterium]